MKLIFVTIITFLLVIFALAICDYFKIPRIIAILIVYFITVGLIMVLRPKSYREYHKGIKILGSFRILFGRDYTIKKNDFIRALAYFEKAVEYDNKNIFAYVNISYCSIQLRYYEEAITALERVIEIAPKCYVAYLNTAVSYLCLNDFKKSNIYLKKAEELKPKSLHVINMRGLLELNNGNFLKAKASFDKILKIRNKINKNSIFLNTYINYSILELIDKNYSVAKVYLLKAFRIDRNNPIILDILGIINYELNRYDRARLLFKHVIKNNPDFGESYYYLGMIEERNGNTKEAERYLEKSREFNFVPGRMYNYNYIAQ